MDKPDPMTCLYVARGCELYRVDGRARVWIKKSSSKADPKTGERTKTENTEEAWLDDWSPTTATLKEVKAAMAETFAEFDHLSPVHLKV